MSWTFRIALMRTIDILRGGLLGKNSKWCMLKQKIIEADRDKIIREKILKKLQQKEILQT